jgi:hypothetical protein
VELTQNDYISMIISKWISVQFQLLPSTTPPYLKPIGYELSAHDLNCWLHRSIVNQWKLVLCACIPDTHFGLYNTLLFFLQYAIYFNRGPLVKVKLGYIPFKPQLIFIVWVKFKVTYRPVEYIYFYQICLISIAYK